MELNGKLRLLLYGPSIVNHESEPVTRADFDELPSLAEHMAKVMKKCRSSGLSAPQVGVFKSFFILDNQGRIEGYVNPEVTRFMGKEIEMSEFDPSIPPHGNDCLVPRMESILIYAGTTEEPDKGKHFKFTGLTARTVHHEIDHLTGTFFIDRVGDKRKRLVLEKYQNWKTKWEAAGRPFPY